jgi:hypothetical protein
MIIKISWAEGVARIHIRNEYHIFVGKSRDKRTLGRSIFIWKIILERILRKEYRWLWTGSIWLRTSPVEDSCEHGNKPQGSTKGVKFLDKLRDCRVLWKDPTQ